MTADEKKKCLPPSFKIAVDGPTPGMTDADKNAPKMGENMEPINWHSTNYLLYDDLQNRFNLAAWVDLTGKHECARSNFVLGL